MVYGRILYNNIKEFTPKWFPTVPYSQTVKPVFGRKPQVVSAFNSTSAAKSMWRNFAFVFQRHSFMWQLVIFGITVVTFYLVRTPLLTFYQANNANRGYKAAMIKEKAHKKKLKEQEEREEAANAQ